MIGEFLRDRGLEDIPLGWVRVVTLSRLRSSLDRERKNLSQEAPQQIGGPLTNLLFLVLGALGLVDSATLCFIDCSALVASLFLDLFGSGGVTNYFFFVP